MFSYGPRRKTSSKDGKFACGAVAVDLHEQRHLGHTFLQLGVRFETQFYCPVLHSFGFEMLSPLSMLCNFKAGCHIHEEHSH